jgi:hypothetical protein
VNTLLFNKKKLPSLTYFITTIQVVNKKSYKTQRKKVRYVISKQTYCPNYRIIQGGQGKKFEKGNMGNDHNSKVTTFQGFVIPSMPLIVALMGFVNLLQLLSHLNHINNLFRDFACYTSKCLPTTIYRL